PVTRRDSLSGKKDRALRLAAEFHQIAGDIFVRDTGAQAGAELGYAVGKNRDAADLAHIPIAAMLKSGRHPDGVTFILPRALIAALPEQSALSAIRRRRRPGDPTPLSGRGLP